jgi:P-type Ca2+ transporter type 2C
MHEEVNSIAQNGLTTAQADEKLKEFGPNALPEKPPPSDFYVFVSQLKNPLVYVLLVAGAVTFFLHEYADTVIILLAVFVNTVLGFIQERKAGHALEALKKLVHPHTKVFRDGEMKVVGIEEVVPGDVVILNQGDKIPADGSLIQSNRFYVNEAVLTGEVVPVKKDDGGNVFMGTIATGGNAKMVVEKTGAFTEMGKIATSVSEVAEETPLGKQLTKFSKQLSVFVGILVATVFLIGLVLGNDLVPIFKTSVALAVSAIPEGLLVGLTVVLAIGMQRILSKKGLVRNLVSAETLGGVTTICVDKTGTLTEGKMQVVNVVGDEEKIATQVVIANDLDDPIVIASFEWGSSKIADANELNTTHQRIDSIPFSSTERLFASVNKFDNEKNVIYVNGAPELLLERSILDKSGKKELLDRIEKYSSEGKRLLGFAQKVVSGDYDHLSIEDVKHDLEWVGMLAFNDPVRSDVKQAFEKTKKAGIGLIVITGDYSKTAISVLAQLGMQVKDDDVILGDVVESISQEDLKKRLADRETTLLFARTKPDQKLKIVQALKDNGEVVAMMGDGVNDAPALSKADIGIVVQEATDVAKESADLVLLDSSFSTIVEAVEEGRGIFDNIRKIVLYLMCDAFVEIFTVITALIFDAFIFKLPLPITAAQILWVNLVSDGFPSMALTVDPKANGIMENNPRPPSENLISSWMYKLIAIISLVGGVFAFVLYTFSYKQTGNIDLARSVTFATVGLNSLVYVFSIKVLKKPFWKENMFNNKWLIIAVLGGIVLQILPFMFVGLGEFLNVVHIGKYWIYVSLASIAMFFAIEIGKWFFSKSKYSKDSYSL